MHSFRMHTRLPASVMHSLLINIAWHCLALNEPLYLPLPQSTILRPVNDHVCRYQGTDFFRQHRAHLPLTTFPESGLTSSAERRR
ncbi:hypothetical protein B0H65DRAFT_473222 [Neurospora tetraspora]|uniref:Secreted protein n=1 Tax=Neurospora tetraspora TaxID=94610 RepID=A0AAE0MQC6_9PEZI|nr:hypothetical protein B0H65DRAFT_473222 [Neurospora tetraspora]